jgi:hypothetical protein
MTIEHNDGLTAEERAALLEDDGGSEAQSTQDADEGAGGDDGQSSQSAEDPGKTGDAAAEPAANAEPATADAAAAAAAEPAAEAKQESAPILVAPVPENVEAQLAEIATKKTELFQQFDDGDLTAKEYQIQLDALGKQERQIELQQERAELAAQMEQQRLENEWKATYTAFLNNNSAYRDNPRLYRALDAEVRELAAKPETVNWSGQKFLEEAHKNLKQAFGFQDGKPDQRRVAPNLDLPPNLAKVPAADVEDTNGGRFAVLDRMASTDPLGYEEALNKMSAAERDAYMAS